jgi:hypothetical protein
MADFGQLLRSLITGAPLLAAYAVGLMFALTYWQRNHRAALLTLLAVVLMAGEWVGRTAVYVVLPRMMSQQGWTGEQMMLMFSAVGFASAGVHAAGLILLYLAAFSRPRTE